MDMNDDEFAGLPAWVEAHLQEAIAETLRKREARAQERRTLARRRAFGLTQRHAAKLARLHDERPPSAPSPGVS